MTRLREACQRVAADKQNLRLLLTEAKKSLKNKAARPSTLATGFFAGYWLGKSYPKPKITGTSAAASKKTKKIPKALGQWLGNEVFFPIIFTLLTQFIQKHLDPKA